MTMMCIVNTDVEMLIKYPTAG